MPNLKAQKPISRIRKNCFGCGSGKKVRSGLGTNQKFVRLILKGTFKSGFAGIKKFFESWIRIRIIIDADPQHWLPEPPFLAGAIAGALFCPATAPTPSTTVNIYFYGTLGYFIFDSVFRIHNLSLNGTS